MYRNNQIILVSLSFFQMNDENCELPARVRDASFQASGDYPTAIHVLRRMRGGSKSYLMVDTSHKLWVVKTLENPQHRRVLVNDFLGTRLARAIGLTVPNVSGIYTCDLVETHPSHVARGHPDHVHFGSEYAGGLMPGQVRDRLENSAGLRVRNEHEHAGAIALDLWTNNTDRRQALLVRTPRQRLYTNVFIDQGHCFGCSAWNLSDTWSPRLFALNCLSVFVRSFEEFEPWLERIEMLDATTIRTIAADVPESWYSDERQEFERLIDAIIRRAPETRQRLESLWMQSLPDLIGSKPTATWNQVADALAGKTPKTPRRANSRRFGVRFI